VRCTADREAWTVTIPKNCKLLIGPYRPPALPKGDRAVCLARDCDVVFADLRAQQSGPRRVGLNAAKSSWTWPDRIDPASS
jgi:hypothetical protein